MKREEFNAQEIDGFFIKMGLENDTARDNILSQGKLTIEDESEEITCIFLDHTTNKSRI